MRNLAYLYLPLAALLNFASIAVLGLYSNDRKTHEAHLALLRATHEGSVSRGDPPPA